MPVLPIFCYVWFASKHPYVWFASSSISVCEMASSPAVSVASASPSMTDVAEAAAGAGNLAGAGAVDQYEQLGWPSLVSYERLQQICTCKLCWRTSQDISNTSMFQLPYPLICRSYRLRHFTICLLPQLLQLIANDWSKYPAAY